MSELTQDPLDIDEGNLPNVKTHPSFRGLTFRPGAANCPKCGLILHIAEDRRPPTVVVVKCFSCTSYTQDLRTKAEKNRAFKRYQT